MGIYVANQIIKLMIKKGHKIEKANVLVLGITFKENCPDIRNSRVIDVINELKDFECNVSVYDAWADSKDVEREYGFPLISEETLNANKYDAVVLAVSHDRFKTIDIESLKTDENAIVYDIKSALEKSDGKL